MSRSNWFICGHQSRGSGPVCAAGTQPGRDARPEKGAAGHTGRAHYSSDVQLHHRALSSRGSPPLVLWVAGRQARTMPSAMSPDTEEYPGAWKSPRKSPPGANSHLVSSQLETSNSLFGASSLTEQETQEKQPPGNSGLKKQHTHTTVGSSPCSGNLEH